MDLNTNAAGKRGIPHIEVIAGSLTAVLLGGLLCFLVTSLLSIWSADAEIAQRTVEDAKPAPDVVESPRVGHEPAPSRTGPLGTMLLAVGVLLVSAALLGVTVALCLFVLLKRYSHHGKPLIRVEFGAAPTIVGPVSANSLGLTEPAPVASFSRSVAVESSPASSPSPTVVPDPLTFDQVNDPSEPSKLKLGFSKEKSGPTDRGEEVVIQYLFDQNVKMQTQFGAIKDTAHD